MRKIIFIIILLSAILSCSEKKSEPNKTTSTTSESLKTNYSDSGKSSFKILKSDSLNGRKLNPRYITEETKYKVFRILDSVSTKYNMTYHIAKIKTISEMVNGAEGGPKKISAEIRNFDNPEKIEFNIQEIESDEIKFEPDLYRIIEYGCCEFNGWIKLYDYQQKLIAEGDPEMIYEKYPEW